MRRVFVTVVLVVFTSLVSYAQQALSESVVDVKTTSAYSMLVLKRVAVEAELKRVLFSHTSNSLIAKVKQIELNALGREIEVVSKTADANLPKLTSGYGMLVLQRARLESERQALLLTHTSDSPDVKHKKVELELLEREIAKVLR